MNQSTLCNAPLPYLHPTKGAAIDSGIDVDDALNVDLQTLYRDAVRCLVLCDRQIRTLQSEAAAKDEELRAKDYELAKKDAELATKDATIQCLEERAVRTSLDLACAMARGDEWQNELSKRRAAAGADDEECKRSRQSSPFAYRPTRNRLRWSAREENTDKAAVDGSARSEEVVPTARTKVTVDEGLRPRRRGAFRLPPLNLNAPTTVAAPLKMVAWTNAMKTELDDDVSTMAGGVSHVNEVMNEELDQLLGANITYEELERRLAGMIDQNGKGHGMDVEGRRRASDGDAAERGGFGGMFGPR